MFQVKMIFRLFCFYTSLFFSNQVNFSQPRSICFNLGQFEAGKKHRPHAIGHRSLLANTGSILYIH